jgi:hypothetical protein
MANARAGCGFSLRCAVFSTKAVSISPIDREHTPFIVPIERHVFYFQKNTFQVQRNPHKMRALLSSPTFGATA